MNPLPEIDFKTVALLSSEQAHKYRIIPARQENGHILCLSAEGAVVNVNELEFLLGRKISIQPLSVDAFSKQLATLYPFTQQHAPRAQAELKEESDVIRFVRKIMEEAALMNVSDIHIERYETFARVRFRWEGQLIEKYEVPLGQYNAIVSRIKILAELDISERRLPQDGRIFFEAGGQKIDVRVSTLPVKFGEKVVLRLLTRSEQFLQLDHLGMKPVELERFTEALRQQNGIILITGPTGSGKTTTLYAALTLLNQPGVNLMTVEDPVEYNIEGINQVQVKEEIGLTFGYALRSFLRQNPNIIMVGEIRDRETAETAIRAALTGHLVFSTLHTNSSWDAVTRLIDMGVEPYLIAASLRMAVAQRLLRVLCSHCKQPTDAVAYPRIQQLHGIVQHHVPVGCPVCHFTGYARRKAIYEVIPVSRELTDKIKKIDLDIEAWLQENQVQTLAAQVVEMIHQGETSLEEGMMFLL